MAADFSVKVDLDATQVISTAKQVGESMTQMGQAGDAGAKKVSEGSKAMSRDMREASQAAASAKGSVQQLGAAMQATGGHASRMGQNIMYAERGAHDILTTFGLASGSANLVGRLARGVDDLMLSIARGGAGMLAFGASMVAFSVAMKAATSVLELFKNAMGDAAAEEKLKIGIKDVVGNAKQARAEFEQLKDFVTGPFGGALKLEDVTEGVRKLQLLTGQSTVTEAQLKMLGAAAQVNNTTFTHVAEQYGRVYNALRLNLPVRAQLLQQMQAEGLITAQTLSKLESQAKAHADVKTQLATLTAGMQQNQATAEALAGTYDNLLSRLQKVFAENIAEPFGGALTEALKGPIADITSFLTKPEIKTGAQNFADDLEFKMLTAFNLVKDQGIGGAWKVAVNEFADYLHEHLLSILEDAGKTAFEHWKISIQGFFDFAVNRFKENFAPLMDALKTLITPVPLTKPPVEQKFGLGGGGETPGASELRSFFETAKQDADRAAQEQKDAAQKNTDVAQKSTDAAIKGNDASNKFGNYVVQFGQIVANFPNMLTLGAGPSPVQPPFPGASRGLSEWKPGEPLTRSVLFGPTGLPMGPGTIAISEDKAIQLFGSVLNAMNKYVDLVDAQGKVLLAHQLVRDVSYRSPGVPNVNTFEVWGRAWDAWAKIVPSQSMLLRPAGQETPLERAQREAREQMGKRAPDTTPKTGAATPIPGKEPKVKDLTEEKQLPAMERGRTRGTAPVAPLDQGDPAPGQYHRVEGSGGLDRADHLPAQGRVAESFSEQLKSTISLAPPFFVAWGWPP
jgi:hypothetical protein